MARAVSVAVPEPALTPDDLLLRARALVPRIRDEQDASEERGHYSEELHEEFRRAGFYRICQPRRFGGYEFSLTTFLRTMVAVSTGDPGSGWCLTLGASHALVVASFFGEDAQAEAFGPDGEFRAPHPVAPLGEAERVDGGWRVSGRAAYASGIPYATWALCNALVAGSGSADEPPQTIVMLVPRRDIEVLDDWGGRAGRMLGMNASGSNSFLLHDAFVPDRFAQPFDWFLDRPLITPGFELHRNPMYLLRLGGPYHSSLVAPVVGAARAALDEFRSLVLARPTLFPPIVPRYTFHEDQRVYGMATAMTDAAETILYGFGEQYMTAVARAAGGEPAMNAVQDARWWSMLQQAGGLAADAVELLAHRSTPSSTARGTRLGRYLRDVTMYRQHISAQQHDFAVRSGALYLGAADSLMAGGGVRRPPAP